MNLFFGLKSDLVKLVINREVEWLALAKLLHTSNKKVEVDEFGVIKISSRIDLLDFSQNFLFILFLDEGASPTSLLPDITSNRLIEVNQANAGTADIGLSEFIMDVFGHCAHTT